ncbi:MAG TPA: EAL domain-containing protein [Gammaproteobacteria bacterium]|nr:EAL domain-containing protein [Gammaproteobacteria bacterium]
MTESTELPVSILVAEDSEDDVLLIANELRRGGLDAELLRVETEDQMRVALTARRWDVVLSDYTMPRFSTMEALRVLQEMRPNVPLIMVSGTVGDVRAVEIMRAGAADYVPKTNLPRIVPVVRRELREAEQRRRRQAADARVEKLSRAIMQIADSVFVTDRDGRIEFVNPAFEALTHYKAGEAIGQTPRLLCSGEHDPDFYRDMWETVLQGQVYRGVVINRRKEGDIFYEQKTISPVKDERGAVTHFVSTGQDISGRILAERERARLIDILETTPDFVAMFDVHGAVLYLNAAARALWSLGETSDYGDISVLDGFFGQDRARIAGQAIPQALQHGLWRGECIMCSPDGQNVPVSLLLIAHASDGGGVSYLSAVARDIGERRRLEQQLSHQARHDPLTGVPNRVEVYNLLNEALTDAVRGGSLLGVIFLDVDRFKRINDTLGHHVGDAILADVANRLRSAIRRTDIIGRHGGDEFVIGIADVPSREDIIRVLEKIREAFREPFVWEQEAIALGCSMGVAVFPEDGDRLEQLLREADIAMYRAKDQGRNRWQMFSGEIHELSRDVLSLETDLARALEREEFELHYQPQLDMQTQRITGVEALLRWRHPTRGMVRPDQFIPLMEESGLIGPVGEWVLDTAGRQLAQWRDAGFNDLTMAVNLSAIQFREQGLLDTIMAIVDQHGLPLHCVELEITETVIMRDARSTVAVLERLAAQGIRLAVDDFGTGYSSLAYLKQFPLTTIKLDSSFVREVESNANDAALAVAIIQLGHNLGLRVVAEGVETQAQADFLLEHGCDSAQGYLYYRPMSAAALTSILGA